MSITGARLPCCVAPCRRTCYRATSVLFDPEIRDETKKRIASELEELFLDESVYIHVQNIVYSAPLSSSASIRFVQEHALGKRVNPFATELLAAQSRVRDLFAVWVGLKSDPLVVSIGHRELTGRLIRNSFSQCGHRM